MKRVYLHLAGALVILASCGTEETVTTNNNLEIVESIIDTSLVEVEEIESVEEQPSSTVFEDSPYTVYGPNRTIMANEAIGVDTLLSNVRKVGVLNDVVIKADIDEVCQMAGCWITAKTGDSETIRVRFKDHFTIPIEGTPGKKVYFTGVAKMDTTSIDLQRHYLDDAVKAGEEVPQSQYDAITEDIIEPTFIADGIMVSDL